MTPEAKKIIRDADSKITKGAALKISRLPPDQQTEAAALLTVPTPIKKGEIIADLEYLLTEFKAHAYRFISGMKIFCRQADSFAGMSYGQSNELWDSVYVVTEAVGEFSQKVNTMKDQK